MTEVMFVVVVEELSVEMVRVAIEEEIVVVEHMIEKVLVVVDKKQDYRVVR